MPIAEVGRRGDITGRAEPGRAERGDRGDAERGERGDAASNIVSYPCAPCKQPKSVTPCSGKAGGKGRYENILLQRLARSKVSK